MGQALVWRLVRRRRMPSWDGVVGLMSEGLFNDTHRCQGNEVNQDSVRSIYRHLERQWGLFMDRDSTCQRA